MSDIFHHKKIIETISEERSFSKAAKKLYIPQPSISVIVKKIEEEIGLPLFDRTNKPIKLTEAGKEYLRSAYEITQIEKNFSNYVDEVNELQSGHLSIGANQMLSDLILPRFMTNFIQKYPSIQIELTDANSSKLEEGLIEGKFDFIIDNKQLDNLTFERRNLFVENLLLAVPDSFESNRKNKHQLRYQDILEGKHLKESVKPIDLQIFKNDAYVLLTKDNEMRKRTSLFFKDAGFQPNIVLEVDRLTTMIRYTELQLGVSFVSDTLVKNLYWQPEHIIFYCLPKEYATRETFISYKHLRYYSQVMEVAIQELKWNLI